MTAIPNRFGAWTATLAAAALLAGCATDGDEGGQASPASASPAPPAASERPDGRGVIRFDDYSVIEARDGDTIEALAARAGVSAEELAAYNGLPMSYLPRRGAQLVLPPG